MDRIVQSISKLFVVLVLMFGNPPQVSLRELIRRPAVALVAAPPPRPPALGGDLPAQPAPERVYIPVRAA
jgi:hypothetical protein